MVKGQNPPGGRNRDIQWWSSGHASQSWPSKALIPTLASEFRFRLSGFAVVPAVDIWHCQFGHTVAHLGMKCWRNVDKYTLPDNSGSSTKEFNRYAQDWRNAHE